MLAAAALLLLAGCSSVKLAYNNSPTLAYWWLNRYVDLADNQSAEVRQALAQVQQWHRRTELPRLADLLQRVQQQAAADVTPQQVCSIYSEARLRFDALVHHAEPASLSLAASLQPHQRSHIASRFEKTNAEWREDWMDGGAAKRLDKRTTSARERAEDFYGRLQEPQRLALHAALLRSDIDPQLSLRERLRRQQDLLQVLQQLHPGPGTPSINHEQGRLAWRGYLERTASSPDPAFRAWAEEAVANGCKTVAELHNSTSPEQRQRAIHRLRDYERHLRELAAS